MIFYAILYAHISPYFLDSNIILYTYIYFDILHDILCYFIYLPTYYVPIPIKRAIPLYYYTYYHQSYYYYYYYNLHLLN